MTFRRDELPVDLMCVTARLDIICRMKDSESDYLLYYSCSCCCGNMSLIYMILYFSAR